MFLLCSRLAIEEDDMIYSAPKRPLEHLANIGGAVAIGLMFAAVGLNVASGCGQSNGQCIAVRDFVAPQEQMAQPVPAAPHHAVKHASYQQLAAR
jgi:hypothetical protein